MASPETRKPRPLETVVLGGCVARDTFEFLDPEAYHLSNYVARTSLLSAGSDGSHWLREGWRPQLSSRFLRRMVADDAAGILIPRIIGSPTVRGIDLLLWDLNIERVGILEFPDGSILTPSDNTRPLLKPGAIDAATHHPFGTDEHFLRWSTSVRVFLDAIRCVVSRENVVLLAPEWALVDSAGQRVTNDDGLDPQLANALFRRYISFAERCGVTVIRAFEVRARRDHPWGFAPFHYDDATYERLSDRIDAHFGVSSA